MTGKTTKTDDEATQSAEPAAAGTPIGKNEFVQAAREIKARANEARWLLRLSEILEQLGDLEAVYRERKAAVDTLEARHAEAEADLTRREAKSAEMREEARRATDALAAELGGKRADLEAELARLQQKINERNEEFAAADRKLRDTRAALRDLRKQLPSEAAEA
jgi:chromosome segregation ATPase